eukprot:gene8545-31836_t
MYHASVNAKPRRDGLCSRPGCAEPIWTGQNGAMSAFCGKVHANNYDAGFKDDDDAEQGTAVQAPTVVYDEYLGALNTAPTKADLMALHKELAECMLSMSFTTTQVRNLREMFTERLQEVEPTRGPTPREVLQEKLSSGKITQDEFDHMMRVQER